MTNYEKIKQMSVEEMAIFIQSNAVCQFCDLTFDCEHFKNNGIDCLTAHKNWLESEVEE